MIKLNLKESNQLTFDMQIEGAVKAIESVSLNIDTKQGYQIKIPAKYINESVECVIPPLDHVLQEGEFEIAMDVVIDGKIFTPLTESIEVEAPVSVSARVSESVEQHTKEEKDPVIKTSLTSMILGKDKK